MAPVVDGVGNAVELAKVNRPPPWFQSRPAQREFAALQPRQQVGGVGNAQLDRALYRRLCGGRAGRIQPGVGVGDLGQRCAARPFQHLVRIGLAALDRVQRPPAGCHGAGQGFGPLHGGLVRMAALTCHLAHQARRRAGA